MNHRHNIVFLALMVFSVPAIAQDFIVLKKNAGSYRYYTPGSEMVLKFGGDKFWVHARIDSITEQHVVLNGSRVEIAGITHLKIKRRNMNYKANGTMLVVAGGFLPVLTVANSTMEEVYYFNPRPFINSAALIGTGFYLRQKQYKTVRIDKRKYRLRAYTQ